MMMLGISHVSCIIKEQFHSSNFLPTTDITQVSFNAFYAFRAQYATSVPRGSALSQRVTSLCVVTLCSGEDTSQIVFAIRICQSWEEFWILMNLAESCRCVMSERQGSYLSVFRLLTLNHLMNGCFKLSNVAYVLCQMTTATGCLNICS
jgi:hypothetical protein